MPDKNPAKAAADAAFPEADTPTTIADGGDYLTEDEVAEFNRNPGAHGARARIEGKIAERKANGQRTRR